MPNLRKPPLPFKMRTLNVVKFLSTQGTCRTRRKEGRAVSGGCLFAIVQFLMDRPAGLTGNGQAGQAHHSAVKQCRRLS